jgi:hypothetical protein
VPDKGGPAEDVDHVMNLTCAADNIYDQRFQEMIDADYCRLQSVTWSEEDGHRFVSVVFRGVKSNTVFRFLFDPSFHWALHKAEIDSATYKDFITVRYRQDIQNVAFPEVLNQQCILKSGQIATKEEIKFSHPEECTMGEENFRLTAYGLPEVAPFVAWSTSRVWIITVNLLVLAVLLLYWRYRSARKGRGVPGPGDTALT